MRRGTDSADMHGCIGHDRPPGPLAAFQEGALRARRGISGIVARETPPSLARKPPSRGNQNRRCNPPVPATKGVPIPHSCWAGCSSQAILTEARSATRHRIYIHMYPYPRKRKCRTPRRTTSRTTRVTPATWGSAKKTHGRTAKESLCLHRRSPDTRACGTRAGQQVRVASRFSGADTSI